MQRAATIRAGWSETERSHRGRGGNQRQGMPEFGVGVEVPGMRIYSGDADGREFDLVA